MKGKWGFREEQTVDSHVCARKGGDMEEELYIVDSRGIHLWIVTASGVLVTARWPLGLASPDHQYLDCV